MPKVVLSNMTIDKKRQQGEEVTARTLKSRNAKIPILLGLLCGAFSLAQGQDTVAGTASVAEKTSSLASTGTPGLEERAKSKGLSERERLLLEEVDKEERRLAKPEGRVSTNSASGSKKIWSRTTQT